MEQTLFERFLSSESVGLAAALLLLITIWLARTLEQIDKKRDAERKEHDTAIEKFTAAQIAALQGVTDAMRDLDTTLQTAIKQIDQSLSFRNALEQLRSDMRHETASKE